MRKIAGEYIVVKPKVERIQLSHGITADDLKDFVGLATFWSKITVSNNACSNSKLKPDAKWIERLAPSVSVEKVNNRSRPVLCISSRWHRSHDHERFVFLDES